MKSELNIRLVNQYKEYNEDFLIYVIRHVSPVPVIFDPTSPPHLEIRGPFVGSHKGALRRFASKAVKKAKRVNTKPAGVTLFHTAENVRYDTVPADYSISFDLGVPDANHFRMPNWWKTINWSKFGINQPQPMRIRSLLNLEKLREPLGEAVLNRPRKMAIFSMHLREPRKTLFQELSKGFHVDGYGKAFDSNIVDHNNSGIYKDDILTGYMFSLCPENGMFPGYYTEKVPESYAAGCIPVTWADHCIATDFAPGSFINLADFSAEGYRVAFEREIQPERLKRLVDTPLLNKDPDLPGLLDFVDKIVTRALK